MLYSRSLYMADNDTVMYLIMSKAFRGDYILKSSHETIKIRFGTAGLFLQKGLLEFQLCAFNFLGRNRKTSH